MSFDVKNIEQENIDFKKMTGIFVFLTLCIVASLIFVYFWFALEKRDTNQDQFLGPKSDLYIQHNNEQIEYMENEYKISIKDAKKKYLMESN